MSKVVLIGIDGADWERIDPYIKAGILPNFKRLKGKGLWGDLEVTSPPSSPPGWNSLFSGMSPRKHKIYDFVKRRENSYFIEPIFSEDRKSPLIWDYLTKANKRTIAISIPFVFPPQPINGIITTGLGTPSKEVEFSYPVEFKLEILNQFPKFDIDFEEHAYTLPKDKESLVKKVKEVSEAEFNLLKKLYVDQKWDLFVAVFRAPDVIQHYFLPDTDLVGSIYRQLDPYIGWFLDNLDKDTYFMFCSDHGFQKVNKKLYINSWLAQNGFLTLNEKNKGAQLFDIDLLEPLFYKIGLKRFILWAKSTKILEKIMPYIQLIAKSESLSYLQLINWGKTKIYYLGTSNGLFFINLFGREPNGTVEFVERYQIFKEFKEKIMELKYKGKPVVKDVIFADDLYGFRSKKEDNEDPDIIVMLHEWFTFSAEIVDPKIIFDDEKIRHGDHGLYGIVGIFHKSKLRATKSRKLKKPKIYDIVPTILDILKIKTNVKFDGKTMV